jgi:hypothetical protein
LHDEGFIFSEAKRIIDERKMSIADGAEEQRDILSILSQLCMSILGRALTDGVE